MDEFCSRQQGSDVILYLSGAAEEGVAEACKLGKHNGGSLAPSSFVRGIVSARLVGSR